MKVYFYSSTGGSAFFRRLISELEELGYEVESISVLDSARFRRWDGGVKGYFLRTWIALSIGKKVMCGVFLNREAIHVLTTNPFFLPFLGSIFPRRTTVQLLYDLYPDVLEVSGLLCPGRRCSHLLSKLTSYALSSCVATVFLGRRIKAYTEGKYGAARSGAVIPVGADGDLILGGRELNVTKCTSRKLVFLYCGNLGRMHDVTTMKNGIEKIVSRNSFDKEEVKFLFHGSGVGYKDLVTGLGASISSSNGVVFGASIADGDKWATMMRSAQVSLVTLADGAEKLVMPSKVYSSLVAGQAIIAICNKDSDLGDLVIGYDCGWVIAPGDVSGFVDCVEHIIENSDLLARKRRNAYIVGNERFDMKPIAQEWASLLRRVGRGNKGHDPNVC